MANLKVNYCGIEYKNPLILASSTAGWDGAAMKLAADAGIGGVIPKTIGPQLDWASHPRNGRMFLQRYNGEAIGMINMELFTEKSRHEWIDSELAKAKQGGAVMHVSILAMPDPDDTARLVEEIQNTGMADLLELNVSCPMPASTVGMHIGKSADRTYSQVRTASRVSKVPFTVKLTPNVTDMVEIAQAAEEAGADGLTISNSIRAFAGVNIETGHVYQRAYGGYTGPAVKPIIQRHFTEVARAVKIPLSAVGGIMNYRDIIEYIMLGATTVQAGTSIMWNGYSFITKLLNDLDQWMDSKGYHSFEEIRGIALPEIVTVEELSKEKPMHAVINKDKCVNCGICENKCFYRAITVQDNCHFADAGKCDGCGLCREMCPEGAITLNE